MNNLTGEDNDNYTQKMLRRLRREIAVRNKIIVVSIGSGLTAKYVIKGGADFLLALNSGSFAVWAEVLYAAFFHIQTAMRWSITLWNVNSYLLSEIFQLSSA